MADWGKGVNNDIGWGEGGTNNIGYGSIYAKSNSGLTLLLQDNTAFIIEVDTSKAGSNSDQFQFTGAQGDYDVVAKQNGIVVQIFSDLSDQETITFSNGSGVYVLEVNAKEVDGFNRITFSNGGDKLKLSDIKQWGTIVWSSFEGAFRGCSNMLITATDVPNLSSVTSIRLIFDGASSFNQPLDNWNVSQVTDMSFAFRDATAANLNVSSWNVINLNIANSLFEGTSIANIDARNWNVSNVNNFSRVFEDSNISIENLTACYENWSQLNLQQNVNFGAGTTKYNASGQAGRDILVNTYNWNITDGGQS